MKLTPAAASLTTAWPAPGVGSATSSYWSASGPPGAWMRMAFMAASHFQERADFAHDGLPPRLELLGAECLAHLEHLGLELLGHLGRPLQQSGDLVHVLVEEREDRDGAEHAFVEVLVHQVGVLVAQEYAGLDARVALDQLEEHGDVVERVAAPVLGDDHTLELLAERLERFLVLGLDLDLPEELHERVLVGAHLIEVLLDRHALREPLFRDHRISLCAAPTASRPDQR